MLWANKERALRCMKHFSVTCLVLVYSMNAFSWGARGHHIVGVQAANLVEIITGDPTSDLSKFYKDHAIWLGHLSNIPDKSWRSKSRFRRVATMNAPTHYWGPERILDAPPQDQKLFDIYLEQIGNLPTDYLTVKATYTKKVVPVGSMLDPLKYYKSVGTLPWRAQQLFNYLVNAFKCAKGKETKVWPTAANIAEKAFRIAPDGGKAEKFDPPTPSYLCDPYVHPHSDLYAAIVISGILSHFIADQGQPLHPTSDHDGWNDGNGGLHSYFESQVVKELDNKLDADILSLASQSQFQSDNWTEFGVSTFDNSQVTTLLFKFGSQSLSHKDQLVALDDSWAIKQNSSTLPYGDHPRNHKGKSFPKAARKSASSPEVLKGFRPLIVDRLATSTYVLAKLWIEAWKLGGSPKLGGRATVTLPFPHDPPFIWPDYDAAALAATRIP